MLRRRRARALMGRVSRPVLQLWFEFASTYSYPAVQRIEALAAGLGVGVEWKPFLLGPVFKSQGWNDSPFNLYPAKGRYMWRDLERLCAKYGLPFHRPSVFPRPSLLAARSEEHTSELQSPDHLVCRLLLEKKNMKNHTHASMQPRRVSRWIL